MATWPGLLSPCPRGVQGGARLRHLWTSQSEASIVSDWPIREQDGNDCLGWGWHILMVLVPRSQVHGQVILPREREGAYPPPQLSPHPASHPSPGPTSDSILILSFRFRDERFGDFNSWRWILALVLKSFKSGQTTSEVRSYCQLVGYQNRSEAYIPIFDQ